MQEYFYDHKTVLSLYEQMEKTLKRHRYIHSVGVAGTAACMAMKYGEDVYKAQIAGILHDCAKSYDDDELVKLCKKNKIEITDFEEKHGFLLHAKFGAYLAKEKYNIKDKDILNAIKWHTTGRENMSLLEKIVFISDYIEPTRTKAPNICAIRDKAFNGSDINDVLVLIMGNTIHYLEDSSDSIDTTTMTAFEFYKRKVSK